MQYAAVPDAEPSLFSKYRRRIDGLREEYQRTYALLEHEGRRLDGFRDRMPVPGNLTARARTTAVPPAIGQEQLGALTARELDILRCIAEGYSTKETAMRLGIRFKTAACHRYRIMQKLGVHETTSLVRFAIRCGVVRP